MALITHNANSIEAWLYNKCLQNQPKRSLWGFSVLCHPNRLLLAGVNNRNVIITQLFGL